MMQRPVMPLVGFVQIDCDLHSHCVWHCTWNRFATKLGLLALALPFAAKNSVAIHIHELAPLALVFALAAFMAHAELQQDFSRR